MAVVFRTFLMALSILIISQFYPRDCSFPDIFLRRCRSPLVSRGSVYLDQLTLCCTCLCRRRRGVCVSTGFLMAVGMRTSSHLAVR